MTKANGDASRHELRPGWCQVLDDTGLGVDLANTKFVHTGFIGGLDVTIQKEKVGKIVMAGMNASRDDRLATREYPDGGSGGFRNTID